MSSGGHRRRGHTGGHVNHERWLLTYADLITLLVVFFIVMYSMSLTDVRKFVNLAGSLSKAFNNGVLTGYEGVGLTNPEAGPLSAAPILSAVDKKSFNAVVDTLGKIITNEGLQDSLSVGTDSEGIVVSLAGSLLFPSGRAELRPEAFRILDSVAETIRPLPNAIRIEGHTDDLQPNTSEFPTNWDLSSARSLSVLRHLTTRGGIEPMRMAIANFAEYRPLVPNSDFTNRAKNRRANLVILFPPSGLPGGKPATATAIQPGAMPAVADTVPKAH